MLRFTIAWIAATRKPFDQMLPVRGRWPRPVDAPGATGTDRCRPRCSRGARVAMVQPTEMGKGTNGAGAAFDFARLGSVAIKREVAARAVVVLHVVSKHPAQMMFAQRNDVVGTFAADASDHALCKRVVPGALSGADNLLDIHRGDPLAHQVPVDGVAVAMQVARHLPITGKGLGDLLGGLSRRGVSGHIDVDDSAAIVREHDEGVQHRKSQCRYGEEIAAGADLEVVGKDLDVRRERR